MLNAAVRPAEPRPAQAPLFDERPLILDQNLPAWARRSDPIVRRHLGLYWKTMALEVPFYVRALLIQIGFMALSWPLPFLFTAIMPAITVSLVALPAALYLHACSLFWIATHSATWVADERRNQSLDLLRVAPRPMREVVFSKIAAAIWRQVENYTLILYAAALCSLPLIVIQADLYFDVSQHPVGMRLAAAAALTVSVLRPLLEAAMAGALGALCGSLTRWRMPASASAVLLTLVYFIALNAARLSPWPPLARVLIEYVLPLALPLAIILVCTRSAAGLLERDAGA